MKKPGRRSPWAALAALLLVAIALLPAMSPAASGQEGITLIVSEECSGPMVHMVALNVKDHVDLNQPLQGRLNDIARQGGLAIIAHPMISTLTAPALLCLQGYAGIEIYNAEVAETSELLADATVRWDVLNSSLVLAGKPLEWGVAVDDAHQESDIGRACNMAPADVVRWHAEQGYSFLAITDHNVVTTVP